MSHPRLCLRTSLGDRAVSRGSPGPIGEPLRDLVTRLEEGSMGQPVG